MSIIEISMCLSFVLFVSLIYQIITFVREQNVDHLFINKYHTFVSRYSNRYDQMSVEIQTDILHFSVETQTEAIIFSVSFKHKRMHEVFGYQRCPPRYLINQLNGNRQASLPRAEVIFNALSVQGVGRVTTLG